MKDTQSIKEKRKVTCIMCGSRIDWDKAIAIGYGVVNQDKMIVCSDTCYENLGFNVNKQRKEEDND
jgi:predicted nucleic acid-binding Zn ribbon protein